MWVTSWRKTPLAQYCAASIHGFNPSTPVLVVVVGVSILAAVGFTVAVTVVAAVAARQLSLQSFEVRGGRAVLQLSSHLCLLGLGSAAPHGSTPSQRRDGAVRGNGGLVRSTTSLDTTV